jgi:peroxiredoxin
VTPLEPGRVAPDFDLRDQHGAGFRLSEQRGVRSVAVLFYPYAFSGVCTGELSGVQDRLDDLVGEATAVVAVSCDPVYSLRAFADRDGLTFPLLSDFWPHGEVTRAYGVLDEERGCPQRSTFVVGLDGLVRWTVHSPVREPRDLGALERALFDTG